MLQIRHITAFRVAGAFEHRLEHRRAYPFCRTSYPTARGRPPWLDRRAQASRSRRSAPLDKTPSHRLHRPPDGRAIRLQQGIALLLGLRLEGASEGCRSSSRSPALRLVLWLRQGSSLRRCFPSIEPADYIALRQRSHRGLPWLRSRAELLPSLPQAHRYTGTITLRRFRMMHREGWMVRA